MGQIEATKRDTHKSFYREQQTPTTVLKEDTGSNYLLRNKKRSFVQQTCISQQNQSPIDVQSVCFLLLLLFLLPHHRLIQPTTFPY